ncbi:MAG: excalibur calcium-binding domain-containing protein [Acidimicrobiales bacterium]
MATTTTSEAPTTTPAPTTTTAVPKPTTTTPPSASSGASYSNCSEAKSAGAAPISRGEPGYSSNLDRDNDGIACET